ncbi:hypothetical protein BCR42DRAFT_157213 [Absidia repens]|uniref:BZIP domain-containing protein n=1 Tax=Absidia repens TaxID=90262 RepID=A0A1X2I125_9FUNG|nr:hypothetical protein BCR42DRAFT_157213 [Absidia repens]
MTMSPHSTSVSKLEDPEDLLLSYLNADCLDTTNATSTTLDMIITKPPLSPSSASFDNPFSPHTSYQSSWPTMPFMFNVNALASACMDSPDLTAGISPRSISRLGSPFSSPDMPKSMTCLTSSYAVASHLADVKDYQPSTTIMSSSSSSSSSSPTISTASSVSSSDADEPKRKRERKKQLQRGPTSSSPPKHQQPPTMMHGCKPILPAASNSHYHLPSPPASSLANVKPEPMDFDTSSVLTTLSDHSNSRGDTTSTLTENRPPSKKHQDQQQCRESIKTNEITPSRQQPKPAATDAQNKRQERLIKNRAAALLSRKRKREHLQSLEQERQWLTKDNGLLKSKTAALEEKVQQLEKENLHQKQRYLLLQQQQHQQHQQKKRLFVPGDDAFGFASSRSGNNSDDGENKSAIPMMFSPQSLDPLSKVTNVLMILLISFALLTLPVTSDRQDKDAQSFSSNKANEKNMSGLYLPLVLHQQQQRLCSHHSEDETTDMDINKDLDYQFAASPPSPSSLHMKIERVSTAIIESDHMHILPPPPSIGKRKRTSA